MSVLTRAHNIFDISGPYSDLQESLNAPNVITTRDQLKQHFGSDLYDKVSSVIATDINTYHSPAAQTMMDVYHHWSLESKQNKTWNDFINNTSLSHIRKNNINIFSQFQDYQYHYTSKVYAPLSEYKGAVFPGDANDSIMKLYQAIDHLNRRKIAPNTCLQVDLRLTSKINNSSVQSNQMNQYIDDDDESSDDDDDDYAVEYTQNLGSEYNFPAKKAPAKPNDFSSSTSNIPKPSSTSNIEQKAEMETTDLTDAGASIENVMRQWKLDEDPYSYKRYEMLYKMESNMITTFEAISNNTLPQCSFRNSPLCRISNSTNSTQEIMNHLNPAGAMMNLLTFSLHLLHDCVQLYMYINSGDKLYGSRIFRQDLYTTVPALFERKTVDKHTKEEIDNINNNMQFKNDKIYEECKDVLFKRNADNLNQNVYELSDRMNVQLHEFCNLQGAQLEKITDIFIQNKILDAYFKNTHRTEFVELLQRNDISTYIANQLWLEFGGHIQDDNDCKICMEEASENQSVSTGVFIICDPSKLQNNQIQRLQKQLQDVKKQLMQRDEEREQLISVIEQQKQKINDQEHKIKLQAQQIDVLQRRGAWFSNTDNESDDHKENDIDNMRQFSLCSDSSSSLDRHIRRNVHYNFSVASNGNDNNGIHNIHNIRNIHDNNIHSIHNIHNIHNIQNQPPLYQYQLNFRISISQRGSDENDPNYQLTPEAPLLRDVSSSNGSDSRYRVSIGAYHEYKQDDEKVLHLHDAINDIQEIDPNFQLTPQPSLLSVSDSDTDHKQEEDTNAQHQCVDNITSDEQQNNDDTDDPYDIYNDDDNIDDNIDDNKQDQNGNEENQLQQIRINVQSFHGPIPREYSKCEMVNNGFNAGDRCKQHMLQKRERMLREKINANKEILNNMQISSDVVIISRILWNAFEIYHVCCVCIISAKGFKNLYNLVLFELHRPQKKSHSNHK